MCAVILKFGRVTKKAHPLFCVRQNYTHQSLQTSLTIWQATTWDTTHTCWRHRYASEKKFREEKEALKPGFLPSGKISW